MQINKMRSFSRGGCEMERCEGQGTAVRYRVGGII